MSHMSTSASPTGSSSILGNPLTNDELVTVVMGTPVYSDAPGGFKKALGDGSAKSTVIGIVVDEAIAAGAQGAVQATGVTTATTAQWDAVCGTSGGLTAGTTYYLSTMTAGVLTTTSTSNVPVLFGLSATKGKLLSGGGGGGSGTFASLTFSKVHSPIEPDPFGPGLNMTAGIVNDYADGVLATQTILRWKGADNQGTVLTGISSTGVTAGDLKVFWNRPELGLQDCGGVTFRHQDAGSLAANRFDLPHESEYYVPSGGAVLLLYTDQSRWTPVSPGSWNKKQIAQSIQVYPNLLVGSVAPVTGTVNNWNPAGDPMGGVGTLGINGSNLLFQDHSLVSVYTGVAGLTVTGLFAVSPQATSASNYCPLKFITNSGNGQLTFRHADAGSTSGNQIILPGSTDLVLQPNESAIFVYPYYTGATVQWHCLGIAQTNLLAQSVSPAALASAPTVTDNWNPGSPVKRIRVLTNNNGSILGGLVGAYGLGNAANGYGEERILTNIGNGPLILLHQSAGSSAGNKFKLPSDTTLILQPNQTARLFKDDDGAWAVFNAGDSRNAITPAALSAGTTNNWSPVDQTTGLSFQYATVIRVSGAGGHLTGLVAGHVGDRKLLVNFGSAFTMDHFSGTSGAGNQFIMSGSVNKTIAQWASVWLYYDVNGFWVVEGI